ncbi:MAG TPA: carbohydrate kinase family protein [Patescibacteria group bacterium]
MYDFVAIGDATLDVFMQLDDANVMCDIDKHNCKLCLNYGDKIAAKRTDFIIGGNAANAAVGARRLNLSSAFMGTIGNDDTGKQVQNVFHTEGVSTEYLTIEKDQKTNYSVVINFQGERTILLNHIPRTYHWNIAQAPRWIYLTSMGEGFEAIYDKVIGLVREKHTMLAYNPGTHQLKKGLAFLKPSIAAATLFFVNKEEAILLLGADTHITMSELLKRVKALGPEVVVITDGPKGSYVYNGSEMYQLDIFDGPVIERTGCGDSFATAFTVAFAEGKTIPEAMLWGNANSTSVLAHIGPQAGLLDRAGIEKLIAKNPTIQPKVLLAASATVVHS